MKHSASLARLVGLAVSIFVLGCGSAAKSARSTEPTDSPQTPHVVASTETVSIDNGRGTVEGTLEVPDAAMPVPLVIIISGSGTQDRDGNTPSGKRPNIYRLLAQGLRDAGIASVRYDDPGYAKSASAFPDRNEDISYEMEIDVVVRWVDAMRGDPRFGPIVLAGHSQGSLTAILAAEQRGVAVVSLAGAGRPIGRVLREQVAPGLTPSQLATFDAAVTKLERGEMPGPLPPPLDRILPTSLQPYLSTWMKYDPRVEVAKLTDGALVMQGTTDIQVSEVDAQLLADGKPDAELVVVEDMCHMLREAASKDPAKQTMQYEDPSIPLHAAVVPTISDFVHALVTH